MQKMLLTLIINNLYKIDKGINSLIKKYQKLTKLQC